MLERYGLKSGDEIELISTDSGITIVLGSRVDVDPAFENALREVWRSRGGLFQHPTDFDRSQGTVWDVYRCSRFGLKRFDSLKLAHAIQHLTWRDPRENDARGASYETKRHGSIWFFKIACS